MTTQPPHQDGTDPSAATDRARPSDAHAPRSGDSPHAPTMGCLVSALAGLAVGTGGSVALARVWDDCDVGLSDGANSFALLPVGFVLTVLGTTWWALCLLRLRRTTGWPTALALALLGSSALVWGTVALLNAPNGYPTDTCAPDVRPSWWPSWLPI